MVTKLGPLCKVKLLKNKADKAVVRSLEKGWRRRFNSVPGHHVFNHLGEIVKPPSTAKSPFIVAGRTHSAKDALSFISLKVIDLLR
jgi:hypothetical protein